MLAKEEIFSHNWLSFPGDIQNTPEYDPVHYAPGGDSACQVVWTKWSPEAPSNLNHSMILSFCENGILLYDTITETGHWESHSVLQSAISFGGRKKIKNKK